jgi:2-hydroxychromene-2-carboxylate isomerase
MTASSSASGIRLAAEAAGVFGTPTFVIDGELFWGSEHLPDIREMLGQPHS